MHVLDLLTPWVALATILVPLVFLERWIHQHLYGMGWLMTQDKERATLLYYLIFLPGVLLHEITQWAAAGMLKIRVKKIKVWPRPQNNGTLRLDFVQVQKAGHFASAFIGLAPFLAGLGLVLLISQRVLDVQRLQMAVSTGALDVIWVELERLFAVPDFWLWLYLLFAVGNTMLPTAADRAEWPLIFGIIGAVAVILLAMGLGNALVVPALQGPIADALTTLMRAFGVVLVLDCLIVVILALLEKGLERVKHAPPYKYKHTTRTKAQKLVPGGEIPLPENQAPKHIADRKLPIPPPPPKAAPRRPALPAEPQQPLVSPGYGSGSSYGSYLQAQTRPTPDYATADEEEEVPGDRRPVFGVSDAEETGSRYAYRVTVPRPGEPGLDAEEDTDDDAEEFEEIEAEETDDRYAAYRIPTAYDDEDEEEEDENQDDDDFRYTPFEEAP